MKKKRDFHMTMMMGTPRSVEAISGNTRLTPYDVIPSNSRMVFFKKFKPARKRGHFFANVATPVWEFSNSVTMAIPEEREYARKENIRYDDKDEPVAQNEYVVPDTEIEQYDKQLKENFGSLRDSMYKTASTLHGMAEAGTYVEAALRDGIGLDFEADAGVYEAFVHLSRLTTIHNAAENLPISAEVKQMYMTKMCELLAQESVSAMTMHDKGNKMRVAIATMRDNHARVRPQEEIDQQQGQTTLGVRKSRREI